MLAGAAFEKSLLTPLTDNEATSVFQARPLRATLSTKFPAGSERVNSPAVELLENLKTVYSAGILSVELLPPPVPTKNLTDLVTVVPSGKPLLY